MVLNRSGDHKPLNVGTMLFIAKTKVPLGRVVGYYFGSVTKPDYVVRLDSDTYKRFLGTPVTFFRKSAQHINEEDLYKRFHDPIRKEFDLFEAESSHVPQLQNQHFKSSQSTEPNLGEDKINQHFDMHYQPMMYQIPETNQLNQMGIVPHLLYSQAPMMYQPEQPFMRPETYQQNQMGTVPNLVPSQATMMYNQHHNFRSSQITEPNLGAQGSTLFAGQSYFNQPFGMQQQPSLNAEAPMMYNQHYQFMRHETNQQNQMGTIPNLVQNQAPMMYNQQQRFGLILTIPTNNSLACLNHGRR